MIIATGPKPMANVLDMVVLVTLGRMTCEDYWVPHYGKPAEALLSVSRELEAEAWDLAGRVLTRLQSSHRRRVERWEDDMLGQADAVFAPTAHLLDVRGVDTRAAFVVHHGVFPNIAWADPASELDAWPRPRVVFVGSISSVVDVALLERLAAARRDWSFVLIGPARVGLGSLADRANVLLTGERPHVQIPGLLAACDVGLIPYRLDAPGIDTVSPLKLHEYRAQGLPVVSVDIPDVREHAPDVVVADGVDGFVVAIEEALRHGRGLNGETRLWSAAVDEMIMHLDALGCPRTADASSLPT
jgi:glycosyltransferase involved in cell wall biosynthesis